MERKPQLNKRVYGLDVFRAVAIILVVHGHGRFMLKGTPLQNFPWIKLFDGVELFFVLSGFLIGTILIKLAEKNNFKLGVSDITVFWKRRWFRTLPNYYLVLFVNVLFVKYSIIDGDLQQYNLNFLFFLQNFNTPLVGFFWESWSLSIEEWFYIFLPVSLFIIVKRIPSAKGVLTVILLLILLPLLYRILHSGENVDPFGWDVNFRKVVLMRLDTIIYGVLAAYIKFYHKTFWEKYRVHSFVMGIIFIFIISNIDKEPNSFFAKTFYFNCVSIGAMLLLPFADSIKNYRGTIGRAISHISLISYSMYLINLGLVVQVISRNFPVINPINGFVKYIMYWLIVLICSTLLYSFFEKPIMNLRDKKLFSFRFLEKRLPRK
jgi:peptidoglycan/LPS O-acetylase OafA/YrhL